MFKNRPVVTIVLLYALYYWFNYKMTGSTSRNTRRNFFDNITDYANDQGEPETPSSPQVSQELKDAHYWWKRAVEATAMDLDFDEYLQKHHPHLVIEYQEFKEYHRELWEQIFSVDNYVVLRAGM
tara:strand:- start:3991 stop:4365 length:375 start_codon:yes stop_codon:yes gene_type:complete